MPMYSHVIILQLLISPTSSATFKVAQLNPFIVRCQASVPICTYIAMYFFHTRETPKDVQVCFSRQQIPGPMKHICSSYMVLLAQSHTVCMSHSSHSSPKLMHCLYVCTHIHHVTGTYVTIQYHTHTCVHIHTLLQLQQLLVHKLLLNCSVYIEHVKTHKQVEQLITFNSLI